MARAQSAANIVTNPTLANPGLVSDSIFNEIADYVSNDHPSDERAFDTARYCLMDALGCGCLALTQTDCRRHLGPVVDGAIFPAGARVPGTGFRLDPVQAAYNITCLIRWLNFNDSCLTSSWNQPSDNLGPILACADFVSRKSPAKGKLLLTMRAVLMALIKAYEIQGKLAVNQSLYDNGFDPVVLVRMASTAVATWLLGGSQQAIVNALSHAVIDGEPLQIYRHQPGMGLRQHWATAEASARGVRLALLSINDEPGYPQALTARNYGFNTVILGGRTLELPLPLGAEIVQDTVFKVRYPCSVATQTAVEAAIELHRQLQGEFDNIRRVVVATHTPALLQAKSQQPWYDLTPDQREQNLPYVVAISLLFGEMHAGHYQEPLAGTSRLDSLLGKIEVVEDPQYSRDHRDPARRSFGNKVTVFLQDKPSLEAAVEYPLGHPRRREEALPLLMEKFKTNLQGVYLEHKHKELVQLFADRERLEAMPVNDFMSLWVRKRGK